MKLGMIFLLLIPPFLAMSVHAEKRPFYTNSCTDIDDTDKYVLFGTYLLETKGTDICSYIQLYPKVSGYNGNIELCNDYLPKNGRPCAIKKWKTVRISGHYYVGVKENKPSCKLDNSCLDKLSNSLKEQSK